MNGSLLLKKKVLFYRTKPDLILEKYDQKKGIKKPLLLMELKSATGDRLKNALHQITSNIQEWMDSTGDLDVYIVVQKATKKNSVFRISQQLR